MNDDVDELIEVEIKKSIDLVNFMLRVWVTGVIALPASAIIADWFGNRAGLVTLIAIMTVCTLWRLIAALLSRLSPGWQALVIEGIPLIGIVPVFAYWFPTETVHILTKAAWTVIRAKA